jgi:hypothetical protein
MKPDISLGLVTLCGVMVSVLVTKPKVRGSKLAEGDGFLWAIKTHTTASFGGN